MNTEFLLADIIFEHSVLDASETGRDARDARAARAVLLLKIRGRKAILGRAQSRNIPDCGRESRNISRLFFLGLPPSPTSDEHQFYGLTSSFTKLIIKLKYICHGLIYLHVNCHDNWTMQTVTFNCKNLQVGGGARKSP